MQQDTDTMRILPTYPINEKIGNQIRWQQQMVIQN